MYKISNTCKLCLFLSIDGVSRASGTCLSMKNYLVALGLGAYSAMCFSCGYFAYDQLDMLRYRLYSGWIHGILMHHLILLICLTLALYRDVTINYLILSLVCELHSIFLHVRKVRRMAGFHYFSRKMVKLEWVLNWTTFVTARVICHMLITYKLIIDAHKSLPLYSSPLESLEKTIRSSIDPMVKRSRINCLNCNEHLPSTQAKHFLCDCCLESKEPQDSPSPCHCLNSNDSLLKKISSSKKGGSAGKVTTKDTGLHKLVFKVLLDGTEVAYYVDGKVVKPRAISRFS